MIPLNRIPTTPGEIIREEYLIPLNLTQDDLAKGINVSRITVNKIINGKQGITADIALRLSKFFNTSPDFWLNLQMAVNLYLTNTKKKSEYKNIKPVLS